MTRDRFQATHVTFTMIYEIFLDLIFVDSFEWAYIKRYNACNN